MRWIWKIGLCAGLIAVVIWQQVHMARLDERYRLLVERQDATDRLVEMLPAMMQAALDRHREKFIVYMESRDD